MALIIKQRAYASPPNNWRWYKFDALNIKSISQDVKYSNFPYFGTLDRFRAKNFWF